MKRFSLFIKSILLNKRILKGFTLIEIIIVIAIIGILAVSALFYISPARGKARDARRKQDISQIGRFLSFGCIIPQAGDGEYDLAQIYDELTAKYPQYSNFLSSKPIDPKSGSETQTNYLYIVANNGQSCALYANLENTNEPITLPNLTTPTAGGGTGVLKGTNNGFNGTNIYFQISH